MGLKGWGRKLFCTRRVIAQYSDVSLHWLWWDFHPVTKVLFSLCILQIATLKSLTWQLRAAVIPAIDKPLFPPFAQGKLLALFVITVFFAIICSFWSHASQLHTHCNMPFCWAPLIGFLLESWGKYLVCLFDRHVTCADVQIAIPKSKRCVWCVWNSLVSQPVLGKVILNVCRVAVETDTHPCVVLLCTIAWWFAKNTRN